MKKKIFIIEIVNSSIGIKGNVGIRTGFIIDELLKKGYSLGIFSRYVPRKYKTYTYSSNFYLFASKLIKAINLIKFIPIDGKKLDNFIFEMCEKYQQKKILARINFDDKKILHIWEYLPNTIKSYKEKGFKIIFDVQITPSLLSKEVSNNYNNNYNDGKFSKEYVRIEKYCLENSDIVISPSYFTADYIKINYGINEKNIRIINFGVKKNNFIKNYLEKKQGINFLFSGVINKRKGIITLLDAWKTDEFKDDKLYLCGKIDPSLMSLLKESNNVITPGFVDLDEYLKKADVYVFPSLIEGSAKSVYEAMNFGLPVITTVNSGSIIENNKHGIICKICDSTSLRNAMIYLKMNPSMRKNYGNNAKNKVSNYTWDLYTKKVINIFDEI